VAEPFGREEGRRQALPFFDGRHDGTRQHFAGCIWQERRQNKKPQGAGFDDEQRIGRTPVNAHSLSAAEKSIQARRRRRRRGRRRQKMDHSPDNCCCPGSLSGSLVQRFPTNLSSLRRRGNDESSAVVDDPFNAAVTGILVAVDEAVQYR
jgi:hypothetical protein